ncbi:MAG TPA: hypothetical protein VMJ10_13475 [Kofleriaceae bacterium]|nr:hypothetical protein [Kofleriaceae bacterium]
MTERNDELNELDLTAWEIPAPPPDLADAVIARMRAPATASAVEPVTRASRRWWLGAALAAVAAAAIVGVVITRGGAHGAPDFGAVAAERARTLELGAASAELDAGAIVAWRREGDELVIVQPSGAASWHVGDTDKVRIDAAEASIDATGASLRVEVHMNFADARLIGASALTAAAVAFATVVVYEGRVQVSSGGQTVTVQPGATVELKRNEPPAEPLVGANEARVRQIEAELADVEKKLADAERRESEKATRPGATMVEPPAPTHFSLPTRSPAKCQPVGKYNPFDRSCDGQPCPVCGEMPTELDRDEITAAMQLAKPDVDRCGVDHPASGVVKVHVKVGGDGQVTSVDVTATPDAMLGTCVANVMQQTTFAQTKKGGAFQYPFVFSAPASSDSCDEVSCVLNNYAGACCAKLKKTAAPACDAEALKQKGLEHEAEGEHAVALREFEAALKCKPDVRVIQYAFMAACNTGNKGKARQYYRKMSPDTQNLFVQMCIRRGITKDDLDGGS